MTVTEEIIAMIADKGALSIEEIKPENTWGELGFDSLDTVELIMAFEDKFSVKISDAEIENIPTVGDAIKYIENYEE